ncbi:hypothetical protein [Rhizobium mayense]|uniref:Uncharacterized protein n=1 Tax=Rhizobium mayense TaxID=1312184 RepID=A0ABT7JQ32_9HYPH|nr:hypothetical protein [Rhizobium mayense]MDL2398455.1 hypothetical protein [Rhizobium mayense]
MSTEIRRSNRPNRVTPFGQLESSPHHGGFMGNRGDLHAADGSIARLFKLKAWICCTLEERNGYRVTFDTPGRYTPLFFWDEAVAMAAGHRPCAQCRFADYTRFKVAFNRAKGYPDDQKVPVSRIDAELDADRLDDQTQQRRYVAEACDLPSGAFVTLADNPHLPHLLWEGEAYPWSHGGYTAPVSISPRTKIIMLTPRILIETMKAGYRPSVRLPAAKAE